MTLGESITVLIVPYGIETLLNLNVDSLGLRFNRTLIVSVKRYHRSARIGTIIAEEPVPL